MSMMAVMKIVLLAAGTGRMGMAPACYRRGRKSAIRMGILRGYGTIGPALLYIPTGPKGTARPTRRDARITRGKSRWPKTPLPRRKKTLFLPKPQHKPGRTRRGPAQTGQGPGGGR